MRGRFLILGLIFALPLASAAPDPASLEACATEFAATLADPPPDDLWIAWEAIYSEILFYGEPFEIARGPFRATHQSTAPIDHAEKVVAPTWTPIHTEANATVSREVVSRAGYVADAGHVMLVRCAIAQLP